MTVALQSPVPAEAERTIHDVPRPLRQLPANPRVVYMAGHDLLDTRLIFHANGCIAHEGELYVHRARCGVVLDRREWGTVIDTPGSVRLLRTHAEKIARPCQRCFRDEEA